MLIPASIAKRAPLRTPALTAVFLGVVAAGILVHSDSDARNTKPSAQQHPQLIRPSLPIPAIHHLSWPEALRYDYGVRISADHLRFRPDNSPCAGVYPPRESLSFTSDTPSSVRFVVKPSNETITTLSVLSADGTWHCAPVAPSAQGVANTLVVDLPEGSHKVYVGTYNAFEELDYYLHVEEASLPDWKAPDDADFVILESKQSLSVQTELFQPLVPCKRLLGYTNCGWQLSALPALYFELARESELSVETSNADFNPVLALVSLKPTEPFGYSVGEVDLRNNDIDVHNRNARVNDLLPAGRYAIFVGSYRSVEQETFTLNLLAQPPEKR